MPTAAEDLKLYKYIEEKVGEGMEGLADSIQQRAQGSAARFAADFPMGQRLVFQLFKQAITYQNKRSTYLHG